MERQSFLSKKLGEKTYWHLKIYALAVFCWETIVLAIITPLTLHYHSHFLGEFYSLVRAGISPFFIVYVAAIIILLDKRVKINNENVESEEPPACKKTITYRLTILWTIISVAGGLYAIFYCNKLTSNYRHLCQDCYVIDDEQFYHLYEECCHCENNAQLHTIKVYQAEKEHLVLCPDCAELSGEYAGYALEHLVGGH